MALSKDVDGEKVLMNPSEPSGRRDRQQDGRRPESMGEVGRASKAENSRGMGEASPQNDSFSGQEGDQ